MHSWCQALGALLPTQGLSCAKVPKAMTTCASAQGCGSVLRTDAHPQCHCCKQPRISQRQQCAAANTEGAAAERTQRWQFATFCCVQLLAHGCVLGCMSHQEQELQAIHNR
jgi:hypothetical protein